MKGRSTCRSLLGSSKKSRAATGSTSSSTSDPLPTPSVMTWPPCKMICAAHKVAADCSRKPADRGQDGPLKCWKTSPMGPSMGLRLLQVPRLPPLAMPQQQHSRGMCRPKMWALPVARSTHRVQHAGKHLESQ